MDNSTLNTLTEIDKIEVASSIFCDTNDVTKHIKIDKKDLTIFSQNIRSIYSNFDDCILSLNSLTFNPDIIIMTECRLDPGKHIPHLNNYSFYFTTCSLNQNDGVVVYIKNTLKHTVKEIKLIHASCLELETLDTIIFCIYRSPSNTNASAFIDSLCSHIETINTTNSIVIAGDININIAPKQEERHQEYQNRIQYLNKLSVLGILAGHTIPTRENSCLDHFMIKLNTKKLKASIAVLGTTITDHFSTLLVIKKVKFCSNKKKNKIMIDYESALKHLEKQNISELLYSHDPNLVVNRLIEKIGTSIKENTQVIPVSNAQVILKPWITDGLLRCIKNRNKLQKKCKKEPHNEIDKIIYKRYRNYCNKLIKKVKRQYDKELLANSVSNNKTLWKNIKYITYTNKNKNSNVELLNIKSDPVECANTVNDYFAQIGKNLASALMRPPEALMPALEPLHTNTSHQLSSFVLLPTDCDEVNSILMSLKNDSAPGWDNIHTVFLKKAKYLIVPIITHLTNLCFETGKFPTALKKSIITPVLKGGDREEVSNYRPISVLPAISKVLEKLLNTRLLKYLKKYNIISKSQFGFQQGKSTEDAVSALSSLVVEQLDKSKKCLGVFLDLKKAFDTVSVPILLRKLESIGIRGTSLDLFQSYLTNRVQKVKIGKVLSEEAEISYGVPQGSVLGPTLFLIYVNDLCNAKIPHAQLFSYADDTAVIFTADTWESVKDHTERGLSQIAKWLRFNLLTLNIQKTKFVCFSIYTNTQPNDPFDILIHECESDGNDKNCHCRKIEKVNQIKYLGVILDSRISWYPHVEYLSSKVRKLVWIFKTLRHVTPRISEVELAPSKILLITIYIALVQSVLTYCITLWGGAGKTKFLELERAQRCLLKVMLFKKIRFPTESLYQLSHVLSVRKLYILHCILKLHKTTPFKPDIYNKRRKFKVAYAPRVRTKFAQIQYFTQSAHLYNTINKKIFIYDKTLRETKKLVTKWLKTKTWDETETILLIMV